jgi:hypothetical protein
MFRIVFWDVLPCKMIVDRRFRGAYCLHHQGRQFWTSYSPPWELEISHKWLKLKVFEDVRIKVTNFLDIIHRHNLIKYPTFRRLESSPSRRRFPSGWGQIRISETSCLIKLRRWILFNKSVILEITRDCTTNALEPLYVLIISLWFTFTFTLFVTLLQYITLLIPESEIKYSVSFYEIYSHDWYKEINSGMMNKNKFNKGSEIDLNPPIISFCMWLKNIRFLGNCYIKFCLAHI